MGKNLIKLVGLATV